uniref:Cadherin domain-containing protein n=1 Tax=Laticauda laticaudata TaxID=8630 RepID=A0A8C5S0G2_LATLA
MERSCIKRQVLAFFLCLNILCLEMCESLKTKLVPKGSKEYFLLNLHSGNLILKDTIDREVLCGQNVPCILFSEIVLENPLVLHGIEVEVEDVNDNIPKFSKMEFLFEISEHIPTKTRFPLEKAEDLDKGENNVQNYTLTPNEHFKLEVQTHTDGSKYAELILEKALDREMIPQITLILQAVDGGFPRRTGVVQIIIDILDANDNVPHFEQSVYKVQLVENSPPGLLVTKIAASDGDKDAYVHITYTFSHVPGNVLRSFNLNNHTGEITLVGKIDYEENSKYELNIKATDGGGMSAYCKVQVDIEDENDNAPEIILSSVINPIPEVSPPGRVVALFGVRDQDSGYNSRTICNIDSNLPFILKYTKNNNSQLVTQQPLDREQMSQYNITIITTNQGSPSLTSMRIITIDISDVNDNPPEFEISFYDFHLRKNNIPSLLIGLIHAIDLDAEQNPASSYISINSETGNLAVDKGSPPLSSETMVRVLITDLPSHPFFCFLSWCLLQPSFRSKRSS